MLRSNFLVRPLLPATALMLAVSPLVAAQTTFDSLLDDMLNRDLVAQHPSGVTDFKLEQASSYDRRSVAPGKPGWFANEDWSNYIRSEENQGRTEQVLMDVEGPGAVTRIWMGGIPQQDATLRFYLDGSSEPFWSGTAEDVIGKNTGYGDVLSWRSVDADRTKAGRAPGMNLYAPIPYAQSLKVTFDHVPGGTDNGLWYVINYRDYTGDTKVTSLPEGEPKASASKLKAVNAQLKRPATAPRGTGNEQVTASGNLAAGEKLSHALTEPGAVKRMKLKLRAKDMPAALADVELQMSFDGEQTVKVPVGLFFGSGANQVNKVQDWFRTVDPATGDMTAYWPMPYAENADIHVVNTGKQKVAVELELETGAWAWDDNSMHLYATYNDTGGPVKIGKKGEDFNYVTVEGSGNYVGDTLQITTTDSKFWWGEGDEKIYVDGEAFPSQFGTGTEDYYGYAWGGRHPETFNHAFVTQPEGGANRGIGTTVNGRVRALDTIPFNTSLKLDMELLNNRGGNYAFSVVAIFYARPGAVVSHPDR